MSDRWRRELAKVSRVELGGDLWERIETGPRLEPLAEPTRSRPLAAVVALAVFVAAGAFVWSSFRAVTPAPMSLAGSDVVQVPPRGETAARFLADGHPVFVAHHDDGTVTVIDAFSPRRPFGIRELVAWCTTKPYFVAWPAGSFFDRSGEFLGGTSAPPGLASFAFEITERDADGDPSVLRIGRIAPAIMGTHGNLSTMQTFGRACGLAHGSTADVVAHAIDRSSVWPSPAAAAGANESEWVAADGVLSTGRDGTVRLCASVRDGSCVDGVRVRGLDAAALAEKLADAPGSRFTRPHLWMLRSNGSAIVDLAIVDIDSGTG